MYAPQQYGDDDQDPALAYVDPSYNRRQPSSMRTSAAPRRRARAKEESGMSLWIILLTLVVGMALGVASVRQVQSFQQQHLQH